MSLGRKALEIQVCLKHLKLNLIHFVKGLFGGTAKWGSISLLTVNAGFQQPVTLLKLMEYQWHKIKAFLWPVEFSAQFSEQIIYLNMYFRNREMRVCTYGACGKSSFHSFITVCYGFLWRALKHFSASGSDLFCTSFPQPQNKNPPAAPHGQMWGVHTLQ